LGSNKREYREHRKDNKAEAELRRHGTHSITIGIGQPHTGQRRVSLSYADAEGILYFQA
jgi:hypothetical protein